MLSVLIKESHKPAKASVIWLHGLGASAEDLMGLTHHPELAKLPLRHVFVNAPIRPVTINGGASMRAWYDIEGFTLAHREDRDGILASEAAINEIIQAEAALGFKSQEIFLAGFSQGGAMALFTALQTKRDLGGVIALSAYLPLQESCQDLLSKETPIFLGFGQFDSVVLPSWSMLTQSWLLSRGFTKVSLRSYPMEHAICPEEISDLTDILNLQGALVK